jgi:1-acyl-sn-glycerol-3-phosphate acyltransferase
MAVPLYPYKARLPAPLYWLFRGIRTVGVAFCFAGFWTCCVVMGWTYVPLLRLWPGTREQKMRRCLRTLRHGFQFFHIVMRVMRMYRATSSSQVLRPPGVARDTPVVLVANHPTLCDVTSIVSLYPDVVAVARTGFADNPLLRHGLRWCGFVPTGMHVLQECEERLRMGFDVLIFPEGTRSPVGSMHPFHRGAFELAARAKVPIVLIKLTCEPSALSKRLPIWKIADRTAVLTIEPFDIIQPGQESAPLGDSRETCRAIEQRYRDLLGYSSLAAVGDAR